VTASTGRSASLREGGFRRSGTNDHRPSPPVAASLLMITDCVRTTFDFELFFVPHRCGTTFRDGERKMAENKTKTMPPFEGATILPQPPSALSRWHSETAGYNRLGTSVRFRGCRPRGGHWNCERSQTTRRDLHGIANSRTNLVGLVHVCVRLATKLATRARVGRFSPRVGNLPSYPCFSVCI
jgi:hypothetical protein